MQPVPDLDILDLTQPAVDMEDELVESLLIRSRVQTEIMIKLGSLNERPDLTTQRGRLRGVHGIDLRVLVEQLFQPSDIAVGLSTSHGWHQMINDRGMCPALGLSSFAGIVDQERIDQWQRADRGVGATRRGHAEVLAREPFQVAVLA